MGNFFKWSLAARLFVNLPGVFSDHFENDFGLGLAISATMRSIADATRASNRVLNVAMESQ
jgi:hypothetical protein